MVGFLYLTSLMQFPLIQLPRKSEAFTRTFERPEKPKKVSINSTSEEVRSATLSDLEEKGLVVTVSINSTSEEVRSFLFSRKVSQRKFPLIQLPRKSEVLFLPCVSYDITLVSINSTSEEVRSDQNQQISGIPLQ